MDRLSTPDDILKDLGGCGRYQIRLSLVVHLMKTVVCFSTGSLIIASQIPEWYCNDSYHGNEESYNNSSYGEKACSTVNGTDCNDFIFAEITNKASIIGELKLVCGRAYIPSLIMSLQVAGALFASIFAGQLSDLFGRKKPFFLSFILLIAANFLGFAVNNLTALIVSRILAGLGCGFFLAIQYSLLSEFTLSKWRPWVIGFPSWPLQNCLLALVTWLIGDWKYVMLLCGCMGVACLFSWWIIPESFRWYIAYDRIKDAEQVVKKIAKFNKPSKTFDAKTIIGDNKDVANAHSAGKKYTFLDMFRSRTLIKVTLLSAINWFSIGVASNGINYGVKDLSGNIYLNTFLFNITSVPAKALVMWLQNRFGRKKSAMLCYSITAVGGLVVGCVQHIDTDKREALTNGFAIFASMGMTMCWGPLQTMTIELYPTVIRNVAFGSLSVVSAIGGIIGPQLVFLNEYVSGLLYFVCGTLSIISVFGLMGLHETNNENLTDKLTTKHNNDQKTSHTSDEANTNDNTARF